MDCKPIPKDLESEALSAEAWNHLAEYAPRLVRAAAEGLGVSLGAIRQMAAEGRITSAVLAGAFQKKAQDQQQEDRDRMAEIDAKAVAYGFSHPDVLRALDAAAMPKFAVGGLYPGDIPVSKAVAAAYVTTSQPSACNPSPDAARLMAELVAEMRALRQDHAQMAALLSRWDGHGLPAARHYGEMIIPKPPRWDGSGHGERA